MIEPSPPDFFPPVITPVCYQFRDSESELIFELQEKERMGVKEDEPWMGGEPGDEQ